MSFDPFAVRESLPKIEQFLERLAAELRVRRAPLETALADLLFVWDVEPVPRELAVWFDAVGAALRDAGLDDEVRRMCAVRTAKSPALTGGGVDIASALLDAASEGDAVRVADLLARLHAGHLDLVPGVRVALTRVAKQLLVKWCVRHAGDYPARFRAELQRLELDTHLVAEWHSDHEPALSAAAALVLDALLDGMPFAVGWLDAVPDLKDEVYDADKVPHVVDVLVVQVAGPAPKRARNTAAVTRVLVRDHLLKHAKNDPWLVTVAKIVAATGASAGLIQETPEWRAFHTDRKRRRGGTLRTVPLTDDMLAVLPARTLAKEVEYAKSVVEQAEDDANDRPAVRERSRRS